MFSSKDRMKRGMEKSALLEERNAELLVVPSITLKAWFEDEQFSPQ